MAKVRAPGVAAVGSVTTISIGALFLGGLAPAAVIALCLMALIFERAQRIGLARAEWARLAILGRASLSAVLPMLMPLILFAGILSRVATPTEVSSFAVVYGVLLSALVHCELGLGAFVGIAIESALLSGMVLFILAAAQSSAGTLTVACPPQRLVALLQGAGTSVAVFMVASIFLLVTVGFLLEGLPALIILAPPPAAADRG